MRSHAGPTDRVAAVLGESDLSAEGRRGRRSKQASRRAAIYRRMQEVIKQNNQQYLLDQPTALINTGNSLSVSYKNTRYIGTIGGVDEAREWFVRHLERSMPEQPIDNIRSAVGRWNPGNIRIDRETLRREQLDLEKTLRRWYVPRLGNMGKRREEGVFRIMGGQLNSMSGDDVRIRKVMDIKRIVDTWEIQGGCLSEVGINWPRRRYGDRLLDWLRPFYEDIKVTTHNNTTENIGISQPGGVAQFVRGELGQYARSHATDFRDLGRWSSWTFFAGKNHITRVVSAYNLAHHQSKELGSVYQQHTRYLQRKGIKGRTPRSMFHEDFIGVLRQWLNAGERLLIFIDLNEHILTSGLANDILSLGLREATHDYWPSEEPRTYIRGSGPIDAVYYSRDLEITNVAQLSFHEGVGDHRTVIVDVSARSMIGVDSFKIVRPAARRLTAANEKCRKRYESMLEQKLEEHNLPSRLEQSAKVLERDGTDEQAVAELENIDVEVTKLQVHAERKCRMVYRCHLEFSLPVQHWVRRRWGYEGLLRLHDRKCTNPANIRRAARKAGIEDCTHLSRAQILAGIAYCKNQLRGMKGKERQLRQAHLETLAARDAAEDKELTNHGARRVLTAESQKSMWKRINRVTNPPRGGAITKVQKEQGDEVVELVTLDEMSREIQTVTEQRFALAESAPAFRSSLRQSVGFTADSQFALDIMNGTEEIPPDVDATTYMLLTEMRRLWQSTSEFRSNVFEILPDDFRFYWRRARERTSSSFANIHFGHWKSASYSKALTEFFARKLTVIGKHGKPPTRWSSGLQVMLEKVAGVALVNKLRAILLMEGDFNFFNKWVFGHRAMNELYRLSYIPEDQYSQRGSTAEDARMDSRLTTDLSRQLRHPMAIAAVDADQCYDRINHIIMSLVLLAVVGSAGLVTALLRPIQTMKFFQRTAWGDSSTFMGGKSIDRPLHGLCQGNGAAPACWLMLSSLLMHCYKRQGFGAKILSPISGILLEFMGEMFVDDTDVIVLRPDLKTGKEVFDELESSAWNWGINLNATGGGLKGAKCYWWLIDYECVEGQWRYAAKVDWELFVPLPDGGTCSIEQVGCDKAMKMLGVWSCPAGGDMTHLEKIIEEKLTPWVQRTRNGHLPASLAWTSYKLKLWPGLRYGLATLGTSLEDLEGVLARQQFDILPLLGINRNIRRRWRTIPRAFGGAGLFDLTIEQTIGWVNMFLQHYGMDSSLAGKFRASLEALQLELGCAGCPLDADFSRFGHLATPCWVKSLWERLAHYGFRLHVRYPTLTPPRDGDVFLMQVFSQAGVQGVRLRSLNRCRIHLEAMFLSDLCSANGRWFMAADTTAHNLHPKRPSTFVFPREVPTNEDWTVWYGFWRALTGPSWLVPNPLGSWVRIPDKTWNWVWEESSDTIWNLEDKSAGYRPLVPSINTRSNRLYGRSDSATWTDGLCLRSATVSVIDEAVLLHDVGPPLPFSEEKQQPTFWEYLVSHGGAWMWDLVLDDKEDVSWLRDALEAGSVMMVADGSYCRDLDPSLCGTGWAVVCCHSRKQLRGSFFERSPTASSYRGELLGMVAIHALITAVGSYYSLTVYRGSVHCDNQGALGKARSHGRRVKSSTKQADLVRVLRAMKQGVFLNLQYQYVKSHQDDFRQWRELPIDQRLNVMCDTLAKQAVGRGLAHTARSNPQRWTLLPFEQSALFVEGIKLTSDVSGPVRFALGRIEAERFYTQAVDIQDNGVNTGGLGWDRERFNLVDWESLHECLHTKKEMFGVWLSKQCMGVCATRRNMARINKEDDDVCPNCKHVRERSDHLNRCPDLGRTALFDESVGRLERWMDLHNRTEPELAYWIGKVLRLRGSVNAIPWHQMTEGVRRVVEDVFRIGWVEFLHGKIPTSLTEWNGNYMASYRSEQGLTGKTWARKFIYQLLLISHAQWLYRNFTLHHRARGYLAMKSKLEVLEKIAELVEARLEDIPEESKFLLEIDFAGLITSRLDRQQYWVVAMQAAMKAGNNKGFRWSRRGRDPEFTTTRSSRMMELGKLRESHIIRSMFLGKETRKRKPSALSGGLMKHCRKDVQERERGRSLAHV